jgi:hypothetical protein
MVVLTTKIYTKTGDDGTTGLGSGERRKKFDLRVEAYGTVDETNAAIGMARLSTGADPALADLDAMLMRIQNDLFDLGADLSTPPSDEDLGYEPLRVVTAQVAGWKARSTRSTPIFPRSIPSSCPAARPLLRPCTWPARCPPRRAPVGGVGRSGTGHGERCRAALSQPPVGLSLRRRALDKRQGRR